MEKEYQKKLEGLSKATPILLPILTWGLVSIVAEPQTEYMSGLGQFFAGIFVIVVSVFSGIAAATHLHIRLKLMDANGFWTRNSITILTILGLITLAGYLWLVSELYKTATYYSVLDPEISKESLNTIFEYLPFGLILPLLSFYVIFKARFGREDRTINLISNIGYIGYVGLPLYGVLDLMGVI